MRRLICFKFHRGTITKSNHVYFEGGCMVYTQLKMKYEDQVHHFTDSFIELPPELLVHLFTLLNSSPLFGWLEY